MTGGDESSTGESPEHRPQEHARAWQHPSEVGLAVRGRTDRRRSTFIATGVVLGGLGLLMSGVLMGSMDEPSSEPVGATPAERAEASVASVRVNDGDGTVTTATGLVLDERGHLLVDASAIGGAGEIWAKCPNGRMQEARVLGTDPVTNLTVLSLPRSAGVAAAIADSPPSSGAELLMVDAGRPGAVTVTTSSTTESVDGGLELGLSGPPQHFRALVDGSASEGGAVVFDRSGDLLGISRPREADGAVALTSSGSPGTGDETVAVITAQDALDAARRVIATNS